MYQIGEVVPGSSIGQAQVNLYANVARGNLVIRDHVCRVMETNGPLEVYYVFNSLDGQWRLAAQAKRLREVKPGNCVFLTELDGYDTRYSYDAKTGLYVAAALKEGASCLRYDERTSTCQVYYPDTGLTETYDSQGLMRSLSDRAGRTTTYDYNAAKELVGIQGPSGAYYRFLRGSDSTRGLDYMELLKLDSPSSSNGELLLAWWLKGSRLVQTQISNLEAPYMVNYSYSGNELTSIKQTDGTFFSFAYDDRNRLSKIGIGGAVDSHPTTAFEYRGQDLTVAVVDANQQVITVALDECARIIGVKRETGYTTPSKISDITECYYSPEGQLSAIIDPDLGITRRDYQTALGLCWQVTQPQGQITQYYYEAASPLPLPKVLGAATLLPDNSYAVTRYVYDNDYDKLGKGHTFLRFEISPEGRVTEYEPYTELDHPAGVVGNPKLKRIYLGAFYPAKLMKPEQFISLPNMIKWAQQQNKAQTSLTHYTYDQRGQLLVVRTYTAVNADGSGVENAQMGFIQTQHDLFGDIELSQCKQGVDQKGQAIFADTHQQFDALQRQLKRIDPLANVTEYDYLDAQSQIKITHPNHQVEIQHRDPCGLISSSQIIAPTLKETRTTVYSRDPVGRVIMTTQPGNTQEIQFFDRQNRLAFTVSPSGRVVAIYYDDQHAFTRKTAYYQPIDTRQLWLDNPSAPGALPQVERLIQQLSQTQNPLLDRVTYEFFDLSGRLRYSVDGDQYLTEYRYDVFNHLVGKIAYDAALTDQQQQQLQAGQDLNLKPDAKIRNS